MGIDARWEHTILVFDGTGGFWFTDLGKTRERDADRGVVYYAKADGSSIKEAIFPLERPNGIAVVDDLAFVVERDNHRIQAFTLPDFTSVGTFGASVLRLPYGLVVERAGASGRPLSARERKV